MKSLATILLLFLTLSSVASETNTKSERYKEAVRKNPDSLVQVLRAELSSDNKLLEAETHNLLGQCFERLNLSDSAVRHFHLSDSIYSLSAPKSDDQIRNLADLANHYYQKGELRISGATYDEALALCSPKTDYEIHADVLLGAGWLFREQGQHARALEHYFKAIEIASTNKDEVLLARSYSVIAIVYAVKNEFSTALDYYHKALELRKKQKNYGAIASLYNNIGLLYADKEDYKKATHYYEKALSINDSIQNYKGVAIQNENLGLVYKEYYENYDVALQKFQQSLHYWRSVDDIYSQCITLVYVASALEKKKSFRQAVDTSLLALDLAEQAGALDIQRDALWHLANGYEKLGNDNEALGYFKSYIELRDSLDAINTDAEIDRIELEMQYSAKQIQDSLNIAVQYEKEQAGILLDVEQGKFWNKLLVIGVIALGVIAGLIFYTGRQRKKRIETEKEINSLLTTRNEEIIDSIKYAKQIQSAILPSKEKLNSSFENNFIFYQPKDIVAGDFYWLEEVRVSNREFVFFAVADCTGHGVPGAMVSVICSGALNKAVMEMRLREPSRILTKVTDLVITTLSKGGEELKDGMDIALCCYEKGTGMLTYSGANNGIWILSERNDIYPKASTYSIGNHAMKLYEIKATKQPVGRYDRRMDFETHQIPLRTGDQIYLFTDGYADQFGGKKNKKFKYRALKNLILTSGQYSCEEQKNELLKVLNEWMGGVEQVDDICIMGIRV